MSSWSHGYVSDIGYTYGYYGELNPEAARRLLLQEGIAAPEIRHACELGFGQGISLNMHAAAGSARWYGTDFNPAHAAFAQSLNRLSGSDADIGDQSFEAFCSRDDLPEFEFIGLHGIWSWISDDNRRIIVDFVRRKLAVGGILYISYNTLPGWSAHAPIRHLLAMHDSVMSSPAHSREQNVREAVDFGSRVLAQSHALRNDAPHMAERMSQLGGMSANYLAHEYLNRDWHPMYFADMAAWLEPAKVGFACSAGYLDDFAPCLFNEEQQKLMNEVANTPLAQTVKDFVLNKMFRRDLWVKGAYRPNAAQLQAERQQQRFVLLTPADAVELKVSHHQSTLLMPEVFQPVLELLADYRAYSAGELSERLNGQINEAQLFTALSVLQAKNDIAPVQSEAAVAAARPRCRALNRAILDMARTGGDIHYLASPVTGGAVPMGRLEQLFAAAYAVSGERAPEQWAQSAWAVLKAQGQAVLKDGQALAGDEANVQELHQLAQTFDRQRFDGLRAIGVLEQDAV